MLKAVEIKARRLYLHMKQDDFAAKLGISRQYLCQLETRRERASEKLEARYNALFGTKRLIDIHFERGSPCPYCDQPSVAYPVYEDNDAENTTWLCSNCHKTYTNRQSWSKAQNTTNK